MLQCRVSHVIEYAHTYKRCLRKLRADGCGRVYKRCVRDRALRAALANVWPRAWSLASAESLLEQQAHTRRCFRPVMRKRAGCQTLDHHPQVYLQVSHSYNLVIHALPLLAPLSPEDQSKTAVSIPVVTLADSDNGHFPACPGPGACKLKDVSSPSLASCHVLPPMHCGETPCPGSSTANMQPKRLLRREIWSCALHALCVAPPTTR